MRILARLNSKEIDPAVEDVAFERLPADTLISVAGNRWVGLLNEIDWIRL